jgi:hypothetical protein
MPSVSNFNELKVRARFAFGFSASSVENASGVETKNEVIICIFR